MIYSNIMIKLAFLLILSLLIHGGKRVAGEPSSKDIPDLTMSEQKGKPVLTEEELKSLNQLRKDVLTSLEDLRKNMESNDGKKVVNDIMEEVVNTMTKDNYDLKNVDERLEHVVALADVLEGDLRDMKITLIQENIDNKSDNDKIEDFKKNTVPGFRKRFEPFENYKYPDL